MDLDLKGKKAVVTGASKGLGADIARTLAAEGMDVFLLARSRDALEALAAELTQRYGVKATAHATDLEDAGNVLAAAKAAESALGGVDALINCAGATKRGAFFELTEEDWRSGFGLKFFGAVRLTRALWPALTRSHGAIVNIVGLGSRMPGADFTIGGSVNSALLNFTKAMSEIGIKDGVRVNAINPGFFQTGRLTRTLSNMASQQGISVDDAAGDLLRKRGVTRFGQPQEVGALVAYLCSAQAAYINGAAIEIDGGAPRDI